MRNLTRITILLAMAVGLYGLVWAGDRPERARPPASDDKNAAAPTLEWLDYGEALRRAEAEDKHVLIDFYTNWCGWCKVMDRKTYADARVIAKLNEGFVIAKINAESAKPLRVGEEETSGRRLAREYGVQSFPMTWFLKPDGSRLVNIPGYLPPERFLEALEYIHTRSYEPQP